MQWAVVVVRRVVVRGGVVVRCSHALPSQEERRALLLMLVCCCRGRAGSGTSAHNRAQAAHRPRARRRPAHMLACSSSSPDLATAPRPPAATP